MVKYSYKVCIDVRNTEQSLEVSFFYSLFVCKVFIAFEFNDECKNMDQQVMVCRVLLRYPRIPFIFMKYRHCLLNFKYRIEKR